MELDIVITWVDGNDIEWQKEKAKYSGKELGDERAKRYREWDFLRYWFRGIEENAPWVRKIHFVTYGHLPKWLNTDHPKLHIVNHKDFIPEEYLPTFSGRPIELNLHRIPGLSDNFVYFNDDMFLMQPSSEKDFFDKGRPCDIAVVQANYLHGNDVNGEKLTPENYNTSNVYNVPPINRNFSKRKTIRKNFFKWFNPKYGTKWIRTLLLMPWAEFTGFWSPHLPYSLRKKTFEEAWEKEPELFDRACRHKFRESTDISSRLLSFWQLAKGDFEPRSYKIGQYYSVRNDAASNQKLCDAISSKKHKLICINDEYSGDAFDEVKQQVLDSFEKAFPRKSSYEIN